MKESVILIDKQDRMIGTMDKLQAHRHGKLHRAFSIFIFNTGGELLLQQRAEGKYHSGGLWTNTCCSHPGLGERTDDAAHRRLKQEMGMDCVLDYMFNFTYREEMGNGLTEYEFDHVFFGTCDAEPVLNTDEARSFRYISIDELSNDLKERPERYSKWLNICYPMVMDYYNGYVKR